MWCSTRPPVAMPLAEMTPERLDRIVRVNLTAALYQAREAARRLPDGGTIVFVSSAAARLGSPGKYVDYAATKGGVDTLTIGLAKELAPRRIRVNGVRPGIIDTQIHADGCEPDRVAELGPTLPLGRAGTAAEVAAAITWLMSDAASYVSGAILDVAGPAGGHERGEGQAAQGVKRLGPHWSLHDVRRVSSPQGGLATSPRCAPSSAAGRVAGRVPGASGPSYHHLPRAVATP